MPAADQRAARETRRAAPRLRVVLSFGVYAVLAPFGYALLALAAATGGRDPPVRARRMQGLMARAYRLLHDWLRVARLVDFDHRRALPGLPRRPCVVVANHPTLMDVTAITAALGGGCTIAKPALYRRRALHGLLSSAGHIEGPGDDPAAVGRVVEQAVERLQQGFSLIVFPEGTRSPPDGLRPFGRAAFEIACRARVPVVSVGIRCEPLWLSKEVPLFRPPRQLPRLRLTSLATDDPATVDYDSHRLRRMVERRFVSWRAGPGLPGNPIDEAAKDTHARHARSATEDPDRGDPGARGRRAGEHRDGGAAVRGGPGPGLDRRAGAGAGDPHGVRRADAGERPAQPRVLPLGQVAGGVHPHLAGPDLGRRGLTLGTAADRERRRRPWSALAAAALIAYPLLVWLGLTHGSPRLLALLLIAVLLPVAAFRLRGRPDVGMRVLGLPPLVAIATLVLAALLDARGWVLAVPVAINALLLAAFGATLRRGTMPMIERFARLQTAELTPEQQAWCRAWTAIWCLFFTLNGAAALTLALAAPLAWWTLYNGLIAYLLMGALFAGEWLLRRRRFGPPGAPSDAGDARAAAGAAAGAADRAALRWEDGAATRSGSRATRAFRTRIPEDYAHFEGHFPGYPVLAAAVQLHELVLPCLRAARPRSGPIARLSGVKFPGRIVPGDALEVRLGFDEGGREVEFEIARGTERCTHGRLTLAEPEGGALRVCAVIPTYDNALTVRAAVVAVREHLPDVILIDDGSGPEGRAACDALAAEGLAVLVRHAANAGKGAAVKSGFAAAAARGFTHVLQVDADGQHDLSRVPEFLRRAAEQPDALILGYPAYDASAPALRRFGHRFNAFWVTLELARADRVVDAQVGFRVYPLAAALAARARGDRMDFDIEIAVRMARQGTPVANLPVGVRYLAAQDGGISHFQPVRDNLRLFRLHTRLCTGGMLRWAGRALGASGLMLAAALPPASAPPPQQAPPQQAPAPVPTPPAVPDAPDAPADAQAAAPADAAALLARFAQVEGLEARFREEKHLALLAAPLVSAGRLYYLRPGYLARVVEEPERATLTITPTELRQSGAEGVETIDLAQHDELRTFVTSLVRVFSGDRAALERSYALAYEADGPSWKLVLTPKGPPLDEMLRALELEGRGAALSRIVVREPNGDRTVTTVEAADTSRRFSAEERAALFGLRPR